jgi:hypothetical protein
LILKQSDLSTVDMVLSEVAAHRSVGKVRLRFILVMRVGGSLVLPSAALEV